MLQFASTYEIWSSATVAPAAKVAASKMLPGAAFACCNIFVGYPFDTVKTRLQLQLHPSSRQPLGAPSWCLMVTTQIHSNKVHRRYKVYSPVGRLTKQSHQKTLTFLPQLVVTRWFTPEHIPCPRRYHPLQNHFVHRAVIST